MAFHLESAAQLVMERLMADSHLSRYVTADPLPKSYRGNGPIRLIVIGQDPTVQDAAKRKDVTTVLNLDKGRRGSGYITQLCNGLGLDRKQNVYATNVYKNFFVAPPTTIRGINIFNEFAKYWHPLLKDELQEFPGVPIISLGQPILGQLVNRGVSAKMGYYWGHQRGWKKQASLPSQLAYVRASDTWLESPIFPYPHINSVSRQEFYWKHLDYYTAYVKQVLDGLK